MKKLILLSVLAFVVSSCGYEFGKKPEPPKPKLQGAFERPCDNTTRR